MNEYLRVKAKQDNLELFVLLTFLISLTSLALAILAYVRTI